MIVKDNLRVVADGAVANVQRSRPRCRIDESAPSDFELRTGVARPYAHVASALADGEPFSEGRVVIDTEPPISVYRLKQPFISPRFLASQIKTDAWASEPIVSQNVQFVWRVGGRNRPNPDAAPLGACHLGDVRVG